MNSDPFFCWNFDVNADGIDLFQAASVLMLSVFIRLFHATLRNNMHFFVKFQREGMTIQAERLNFHRYISHFRSVHRGSSFAKMRTTTVRKLLPEYVILTRYYIIVFLHPTLLVLRISM